MVRGRIHPTGVLLVGITLGACVGSTTQANAPGTPREATLHVTGGRLRDTCGNPVVMRGVEWFTWGWDANSRNWYRPLIARAGTTGLNAFRLAPDCTVLGNYPRGNWVVGTDPDTAELDWLFAQFSAQGIIWNYSLNNMPNWGQPNWDEAWWSRQSVKDLVTKYQKWIMIDAMQEFQGNDRVAWKAETLAKIAWFRSQGYTVPLNIIINQYGRDLQSILEINPATGKSVGQEIFESDPLRNVVFGWQAYWSNDNVYQSWQGMTLQQGIEAVAKLTYPVQIGIELYTEDRPGGPYMDYMGAMTWAEQNKSGSLVGWLWWNWTGGGDWYSLTNDWGLTWNTDPTLNEPFGNNVATVHPYGLHSGIKVCGK